MKSISKSKYTFYFILFINNTKQKQLQVSRMFEYNSKLLFSCESQFYEKQSLRFSVNRLSFLLSHFDSQIIALNNIPLLSYFQRYWLTISKNCLSKCSIQQVIMQSYLLNQPSRPTMMADIKKSTRAMRTRQDYQLFRINYPHYDPQTIKMIQIYLGPEQKVSLGQSIGYVYLKKPEQKSLSQKEQSLLAFSLTTSVVGKIERIGDNFVESQNKWTLIENTRKGSLELMYIRECEHIIKNQSTRNTDITDNSKKPTPYQQCPKCNRIISMYYQSQEQIITLQNLCQANPRFNAEYLNELQWNIVLNQQFTPTTAIARVGDLELSLPAVAKATYLLGEGEKPVKNVIMKIRRVFCEHEEISNDRCKSCLKIIKSYEMQQFTRYHFQFGPKGVEMSKAKGAALFLQEQEYIKSILQKKRLILILDLDNTILHTNDISEIEWDVLLKVKDFFLLPRFQAVETIKQEYAIVKMRPYFKEFLLVIGKLFQVYIYTKGTRIYADSICGWIRAQWAGETSPYEINTWSEPQLSFLKDTECFVPYRIISRSQDSNLDKKSVQKILPTKIDYHMILDDRRDVWGNSSSCFFTRDYIYFCKSQRKSGCIVENNENFLDSTNQNLPYLAKLIELYKNARQSCPQKINQYKIELNERADYFLLFAAHAMRKMHHLFFQQFKKPKQQKTQSSKVEVDKKQLEQVISLSYILQRSKQFIRGKKIRFFLPPYELSISTARRSIKLGGTMLLDKNTEKPDIVIRGNEYMKFIKEWRSGKFSKEQANQKKQSNTGRLQQINKSQQKIKETISVPQQLNQQHILQQMRLQQCSLLQHKEQIKMESQINKKSRIDLQIQKQIMELKPDYQVYLQQLETLHKSGVPVISETWIHACYEYTYRFKKQDFKIQDPFKENIQHSDFDSIIAQTAEKIRIEINNHYTNNTDNEKKRTKQREEKSSSAKKSKLKQQQIPSAQKLEVSSFKSEPPKTKESKL